MPPLYRETFSCQYNIFLFVISIISFISLKKYTIILLQNSVSCYFPVAGENISWYDKRAGPMRVRFLPIAAFPDSSNIRPVRRKKGRARPAHLTSCQLISDLSQARPAYLPQRSPACSTAARRSVPRSRKRLWNRWIIQLPPKPSGEGADHQQVKSHRRRRAQRLRKLPLQDGDQHRRDRRTV